jgi:hypothetical protein
MSLRLSRVLALVVAFGSASTLALVLDGCGADSADPADSSAGDTPTPKEAGGPTNEDSSSKPDAKADAEPFVPDADVDASCPKGKILPATGETCVGFGKGTPCDTACGLPQYGYVCFSGGPPGFAGCVQASSSAFGETYCCPDNKCVAQPDQDAMCTNGAKPHRYQCPPNGSGGNVAPPAGCTETGSGTTPIERFYCCP